LTEGSRGTALVTGASRGIGAAIARRLAAAGYRVFGTSRNGDGGDGTIEMLPLEVRDDASAEACIASVIGRTGRIDVLVNNAGFDLYGALEETSMESFHEQIDVNFMGTVRVTKAVLPGMRAQGSGRIIMIGSLGGLIALPFNSAYSASKFAIDGFCESLRFELVPHGVHVSVVVTGAVATESLGRSIREVADTSGPYAVQRSALVRKMRRDGLASPVKPDAVADAVLECVSTHRPRLRYKVGNQAVWAPRMKAFLPQGAFESTMRRMFLGKGT
jgi:short-subunit dehydrogenase